MAVDFLILGPSIGNVSRMMKHGLRSLGAHKVAWVARNHGYNALAITKLQLLSEDEIVEICSKFVGPKTLIGISTTLMAIPNFSLRQNNTDFRLLTTFSNAVKRIRERYDNKIIVGGQVARKFVDIFNANYIMDGLSVENEIPKFLDQHFRNGIQRKPYDWHITKCDFNWHETDFIQQHEPLPIETCRGCIFKCKFCGYGEIGRKKGTFEKDMSLLKDHIVTNYEKYKTTNYVLSDDTFNDDDDRMNEWCDMLESLPFKITYGGYVRLDLFERYQNTAKRLYHNGLRGCSFGIETFHPYAAKVIGKSFSATKGKEFLDYFWEVLYEKNVFIIVTNIVGLPGESLESSMDAQKWYLERPYLLPLWSPVYVSKDPLRLVSQSEFGKTPEKWGYKFREGSDMVWYNEHMTLEQATELVSKFYKEINFDPVDCWSQQTYFAFNKMEPKDYHKLSKEERVSLCNSIEVDIRKMNDGYFNDLRRYGDSQ